MYKAEIIRGVEFLDLNHPGWEKKIDLQTLKLSDCTMCVIAQVVGFGKVKSFDPELGFDIHFRTIENYQILQNEWTEIIKKRLSLKCLTTESNVTIKPLSGSKGENLPENSRFMEP